MCWHLWQILKCSFLFIFTESNFSGFYERVIMMGLDFLFPILQLQLQNVPVFSLLVPPSLPLPSYDYRQNLFLHFCFMVIPILYRLSG